MRFIVSLIGWILFLAAIGVAIRSGLAMMEGAGFQWESLGQLWYEIDRFLGTASLNLVQAVVQRYLFPEIWDPAIVWLLLQPAILVLGIPGLLLILLCRRGHAERKRIFHS